MPDWIVTDPKNGSQVRVTAPTGEAAKQIVREQRGAQEVPQTTVAGMAKAGASGLVRGVAGMAGLPGDVYNLIDAGVRNAPRLAGYPAISTGKKADLPTTESLVSGFEQTVTPLYNPRTAAERYFGKFAEYAPAIVSGPGNLTRRALQQVVAPAVGEETAGELAKGTKYEPYARFAGSLGGATVAAPLVHRAVTPNPTPALRVQHAQTLRQAGVNPTAGQETGNYRLQAAESELGRGGAPGLNLQEGEEFTAATLREMGETQARNVTPQVIEQNRRRLGAEFDRLGATYTLNGRDPQLIADLRAVWRRYSGQAGTTGASARAPIVEGTIRDIVALGAGRRITGNVYQTRRSDIDRAMRDADTASLKSALGDLRDALDDAMERSMASRGRRGLDDIAQWREIRRQYGNLMTVEDAMLSGGAENRGMGIITPSALAAAASRGTHKRKQFVRGRSDYSDLALAGQAVLTPFPQSGTATRTSVNAVPAAVGTLLGGGLSAGTGDISHTLMGAAAGQLAGMAGGRTLMSRPAQAYLRNQLLGPTPQNWGTGRQAALTTALHGPRILAPLTVQMNADDPRNKNAGRRPLSKEEWAAFMKTGRR